MDKPSPRSSAQSGAFRKSEALRAFAHAPRLEELSLQDVNEIRLLLRGESAIDWYKLDFEDPQDVLRLFRLNGLDYADQDDLRRLDDLRQQSVRYVVETLQLKLHDHVASDCSVVDLALLASKNHRHQRSACLVLKVMHIIYHLDARELRTLLAIADNELFALVEESVVRMFDELRAAGVPVVEFSWSRKTRSSLITKMMIKRRTSAARVFDRLRFRVIVRNPDDLEPTLHVMLRRCIPFNYVVPGQTVNTLMDPRRIDKAHPKTSRLVDEASAPEAGEEDHTNEFSAAGFRILNFIADLPVRVDDLLRNDKLEEHDSRGRVVFVLAEFQIMDQATATMNEEGDASHAQYKIRQHSRVKERLLRSPTPHRRVPNTEE